MNSKDQLKFTKLKEKIIENNYPTHLSELEDFPFTSLSDLKLAYEKNKYSIACEYSDSIMKLFSTKGDMTAHLIWATLPYVIILSNIILAIILSKYILLLSIPLSLLGNFASSPYSPFRNFLSGFGGILFIISFFLFSWPVTVIIGSMLFSQIFSMTAREQYRIMVMEKALNEEILFCFLYLDRILILRNNETKIIYRHFKQSK